MMQPSELLQNFGMLWIAVKDTLVSRLCRVVLDAN